MFFCYTLVLSASLTLLILSICGLVTTSTGQQFGDLCAQLYLCYFYAATSALFVVLLDWTVAKRRGVAAILSIVALVPTIAIAIFKFAPLYFRVDKAPANHNLTLLQFNLLGDYNKDRQTLFREIEQENVDVALISELCGDWENDLDKLMNKQLPYCDNIDKDSFLRIYSKFPIVEKQIRISEFDHRSRLLVKIAHPQLGLISIILVHPIYPLGKPIYFEERNKEFALYSEDLKTLGAPAILAGDLNCTPWSPYFGKILEDCHLKDSERGFGVQPSFPAPGLPLMYVPLLPIDHVLVSDKIYVKERKLLRHAGSDHYPLLVRLYVDTK